MLEMITPTTEKQKKRYHSNRAFVGIISLIVGTIIIISLINNHRTREKKQYDQIWGMCVSVSYKCFMDGRSIEEVYRGGMEELENTLKDPTSFDSKKYIKKEEAQHLCLIKELGTGMAGILESEQEKEEGLSPDDTPCNRFADTVLALSKLSSKERKRATKIMEQKGEMAIKLSEEYSKYIKADIETDLKGHK